MSKTIPPMLELKGINKSFKKGGQRLQVLEDVHLIIKEKQKVAIVGPSGSGKSTLLYLMGLLDQPTAGKLLYHGHDLSKSADKERAHLRNKKFGFVYQHHYLLPEFTALENVMMPAIIAGKSRRSARMHAIELLKEVGLGHRMRHYPAQLSGGEQQRVAVARALFNEPEILFADEPTGNLDAVSTEKVYAIFDKLVQKSGSALVLVTHNRELAERCDLIYTIQKGHCTLERGR